jgi:hypothetical protein
VLGLERSLVTLVFISLHYYVAPLYIPLSNAQNGVNGFTFDSSILSSPSRGSWLVSRHVMSCSLAFASVATAYLPASVRAVFSRASVIIACWTKMSHLVKLPHSSRPTRVPPVHPSAQLSTCPS